MATTTNYSWTTPDDTDLVKDGAAAIRTLGSSADTTVKNLNPGTTAGDIDYYTSSTAKARVAIGTAGQVLKVNSGGTAPEWATTADQTPLTTKGDLFTFDTADARLGVGANGTVLTADSAETTGLKWAAPAPSYTPTLTLLNSGGTSLSGSTTTISGISGKQWLFISVVGASTNTASSSLIGLQFNGDTGSNYPQAGILGFPSAAQKFGLTEVLVSLGLTDSTAGTVNGYVNLYNCNSTELKPAIFSGSGTARGYTGSGYYSGASTISSVSVTCTVGTFDAGTVYVYGA